MNNVGGNRHASKAVDHTSVVVAIDPSSTAAVPSFVSGQRTGRDNQAYVDSKEDHDKRGKSQRVCVCVCVCVCDVCAWVFEYSSRNNTGTLSHCRLNSSRPMHGMLCVR